MERQGPVELTIGGGIRIPRVHLALCLFAVLAAGIVAATGCPVAPIVRCALFAAGIALWFLRKVRASDIFLLFGFFLLGVLSIQPYQQSERLLRSLHRQQVTVEAEVTGPVITRARFDTYSARVHGITVQVRDYSRSNPRLYGRYLVSGRLLYGRRNFRPLLIVSRARPPESAGPVSWPKRSLAAVSEGVSALFYRYVPVRHARFLESVVLGRDTLDWETKDAFRKAGTAHVLVISGLHVGIVAMTLMLLLKALGIPYRPRYLVASLIVLGYAALCAFKPPVLRAAVMFWLYAYARLRERPFLSLHALFTAAIVGTVVDPPALLGASFQLSFTAVLAIILGTRYVWYPRGRPSLRNDLLGLTAVSIYATLGLMPLTAFYFGHVHVLSWLYSLLAVPLLGFVINAGAVFLAVSWVEPAAVWSATALSALLDMFVGMNIFAARLPGRIELRFQLWHIFIFYGVAGMMLIWWRYCGKAAQKSPVSAD